MATVRDLEELQFFKNYDEHVLEEFLTIAFEYLNNNVKPKAYASAAQKLQCDAKAVEHIIEILAYLLLESTRLNIQEHNFIAMLKEILPESMIAVIWEMCQRKNEPIKKLLSSINQNHSSYSNLEWRLECQVASRSMHQHQELQVLMNLILKDKHKKNSHLFQTDIPNLLHLTEVLESALNESRSSHVRKVVHHYK